MTETDATASDQFRVMAEQMVAVFQGTLAEERRLFAEERKLFAEERKHFVEQQRLLLQQVQGVLALGGDGTGSVGIEAPDQSGPAVKPVDGLSKLTQEGVQEQLGIDEGDWEALVVRISYYCQCYHEKEV